jgi:transketolase
MTDGAARDAGLLALLADKAAQLRIDSIRATTAAGSGHPTSCASAAEIVATLFFRVMRYHPHDPHSPANDVFVLSKGHAAPILYSAWAEAGLFPRERLLTLRQLHSDLEGHPTPRLPFVDAATGSLGQGLSVGLGIAINGRELAKTDQRVFVLLGDGETAEGSVWEAAELAGKRGIANLCATVDVNRLGQSQPTMLQHDMEVHRRRWEAFGWHAIVVDGHDLPQLLDAYESAAGTTDRPTVVLARTLKGKGFPGIEDKENWHGKALDAATAERVIAVLESGRPRSVPAWTPHPPSAHPAPLAAWKGAGPTPYAPGGKPVATRRAFGDALAKLAEANTRIVVIDGDVENSTYTETAQKAAPGQFIEGYIAEQNMLGMAMGLAARGRIPFVATFSAFLARAFDFVRMAAISGHNIKVAGTHSGVSIGEDGGSQMGLEDLASIAAEPTFTVLYPSDATSTWRAVELAAEHSGPCYLRLGRPEAAILYGPETEFAIGRCQVLRTSDADRVLLVAAGVTVPEALAAADTLRTEDGIHARVIDLFSVQPIDHVGLREAARAVGGFVLTVEDHYAHGGIGDATLAALASERVHLIKLAVREIPHSGKPAELLDRYGISARHIVGAVRNILGRK